MAVAIGQEAAEIAAILGIDAIKVGAENLRYGIKSLYDRLKAEEMSLKQLAFLQNLTYLLFLPDEYVEDIWMITSLMRMARQKTGKVQVPVPQCFDKFEVVDANFNGQYFVLRVLALTKPPYPNMVYVYGDVANPHYVRFADKNDEKYLTIYLNGQRGRVYFDWYLSEEAIATYKAQVWDAIDTAIRNGDWAKALSLIVRGDILLKGFRPEDVQMSPDIVPTGPDTAQTLITTPNTEAEASKFNDQAQNVAKHSKPKDEALAKAIKAVEATYQAMQESGVGDYEVYQIDNITAGLEKDDTDSVVSVADNILKSLQSKGKSGVMVA